VFDVILFLSSGIAYFTGRLIAAVLFPHLQIEPFDRQRSIPRRWNHKRITYEKGGQRFLYMESIEMIGTAFWLVALSAFIGLMVT
jgi:hypothetical protein